MTLPRFSLGFEGTENIIYFFYKFIIFRVNKKKDDIRSKYLYFDFFHETVNSHNLEGANNFVYVIFVLHSVMKTQIIL